MEMSKKFVCTFICLILIIGYCTADQEFLKFKWKQAVPGFLMDIGVSNVDKEGDKEVIIGTKHCSTISVCNGYIYAFDREGRRWLQKIDGGVYKLIIFDINNDGWDEIIATSGTDSHAVHYGKIYLLDHNGTIITMSKTDWPLYLAEIHKGGDKGKMGIVGLSAEGNIYLYNNKLERMWIQQVYSRPESVISEDIDSDGVDEILVGTNDGELYVFSDNGSLEWKYKFDVKVGVISVGRIDSEGKTIVIGAEKLYALNSKGRIKWSYDLDSKKISAINLKDIDNTGFDAIIFGTRKFVMDKEHSGALHVVYSSADELWNYIMNRGPVYIDVQDIDMDGNLDIVATSSDSRVYVFNKTGGVLGSFSFTGNISIKKVVVDDIDYDDIQNIVMMSNENIAYIFELNPKLRAYILCDMGEKYLKSENFSSAKDYVRRAERIYISINDTAGIKKCNDLMDSINRAIRIKENIEAGNNYYENARKYFEAGDYKGALIPANNALLNYTQANYNEGIAKINSLISDAKKHIDAENNYVNALTSFKNYDYDNTIKYAKNAMEIYASFGDENMVEKCNALINRSNAYYSAEELYEKGKNAFISDQYVKAATYLMDAKTLYEFANYSNGSTNCNNILIKIMGFSEEQEMEIKQKNLATIYYHEAMYYYSAGDYINASKYAEKAEIIYLVLGNKTSASDMSNVSEESKIRLLKRSEDIIELERSKKTKSYIIASVVVVLGIIALILIYRKYKILKKEEKIVEKEIDDAESMLNEEKKLIDLEKKYFAEEAARIEKEKEEVLAILKKEEEIINKDIRHLSEKEYEIDSELQKIGGKKEREKGSNKKDD